MTTQTNDWKKIDWASVTQDVRQMQAELVQAERAGNERGVIYWQDRIVQSRAAKLCAVQHVTSTNGRYTPGVDGERWTTPEQKMQAVERLDARGYEPEPARRVMIPKDDGRERPLGILTMHDRAMQALYLLALDPIAECRADPHSYGFRKYRSRVDAIQACAAIFAPKDGPAWVLEADIEACFDSISHDWLLRHVPLPKPLLRAWLRAGYVQHGQFQPTLKGLPQGGILSPVLANLALNGMEAMLTTYFHQSPAYQARSQIAVVRYADDFIVAGADKRMLHKEVHTLLANFLAERGMQFSERKTKLTQIQKGFDFLGYHVVVDTPLFGQRRMRITPRPKSVQKLLTAVAETIDQQAAAEPAQLIQTLNLTLRSWAGHYTFLADRGPAFQHIDQEVFRLLLAWAKRRHPRKSKRWLLKTYWMPRTAQSPPVFGLDNGPTLCQVQALPQTTHIPIDPVCNIYDPKWAAYLAQRDAEH